MPERYGAADILAMFRPVPSSRAQRGTSPLVATDAQVVTFEEVPRCARDEGVLPSPFLPVSLFLLLSFYGVIACFGVPFTYLSSHITQRAH